MQPRMASFQRCSRAASGVLHVMFLLQLLAAAALPAHAACEDGEYSLKGGGGCKRCTQTSCPTGAYRTGTCSGTSNGYMCKECANVYCESKYRAALAYHAVSN